jgi:hypothetical protein
MKSYTFYYSLKAEPRKYIVLGTKVCKDPFRTELCMELSKLEAKPEVYHTDFCLTELF